MDLNGETRHRETDKPFNRTAAIFALTRGPRVKLTLPFISCALGASCINIQSPIYFFLTKRTNYLSFFIIFLENYTILKCSNTKKKHIADIYNHQK
jgi:hypothetical protein